MFKLEGSFAAIPTPFKNGKLDETGLKNIVRLHLKAGTNGILACGSTGEAATLSPDEYLRVIKTAVEEAGGKIPVMAGAGTNSTEKSVEMVRKLSGLNIAALLIIVPYYNKPTQEGMILHFKEIAGASDFPLVVYNIPGRTGVNMLPATLLKLKNECPKIIGVKEASGNIDQVGEILNILGRDFQLMSGDDALTLPMMSLGAKGVISVTANVAPKETSDMCRFFSEGKTKEAAQLHHKLLPLTKALFTETNPIPVKAALSMMGICGETPRMPLTPITPAGRTILRKAMENFGINLSVNTGS